MDLPVLPADALLALRARAPERPHAEHAVAPSPRSEAFAEDLRDRPPQPAARLSMPALLLALAPLACALPGAVVAPRPARACPPRRGMAARKQSKHGRPGADAALNRAAATIERDDRAN